MVGLTKRLSGFFHLYHSNVGCKETLEVSRQTCCSKQNLPQSYVKSLWLCVKPVLKTSKDEDFISYQQI